MIDTIVRFLQFEPHIFVKEMPKPCNAYMTPKMIMYMRIYRI